MSAKKQELKNIEEYIHSTELLYKKSLVTVSELEQDIDNLDKELTLKNNKINELDKEIKTLNEVDNIIKQINILRTDEVCEIYKAILDSYHAPHLDKF